MPLVMLEIDIDFVVYYTFYNIRSGALVSQNRGSGASFSRLKMSKDDTLLDGTRLDMV